MPAALLDDAHDLGDRLRGLSKFAACGVGCIAALAIEPVGFLRVGTHGFGRHVRRHHALAQPGQHAGFQRLPGDGSGIVAAVAQDVVGAGVAILPATGIRAAATATEQQAGQQGAWAMRGVHCAIPGEAALRALARCLDPGLVARRQLVLLCLGGVPKLLRHDAKLGRLRAYPFAFRIEPIGEVAGVGVLEFSLPIPADDSDVKLAIQDAGTDDPVAPDRGVIPALAGGAGDAVAVQIGGDALRPLAGDIFAEDASHDLGLFLDDLTLAPDRLAACVKLADDAVAIGVAAADLAGLDAAADAAMGVDGEVFQEQRVHGAFETDMKLVDLALGEGEDRHARETQALEDAGHVLLIAADAVQRLGQHHVEAA